MDDVPFMPSIQLSSPASVVPYPYSELFFLTEESREALEDETAEDDESEND